MSWICCFKSQHNYADQNFGYERIQFQLSVAVVVVRRNLLWAWKSVTVCTVKLSLKVEILDPYLNFAKRTFYTYKLKQFFYSWGVLDFAIWWESYQYCESSWKMLKMGNHRIFSKPCIFQEYKLFVRLDVT